MRIEFAPPPAPPQPKTSWLAVFALAFLLIWATMLGLVMWGPGQPPIERFVSALAHQWRQTGEEVGPQQVEPAMEPSLRASLNSRARSAAILGARPGY
jgi:hypothetical protein